MLITEADALAEYPELAALATLRDAGWQFLPLHDDIGAISGIDGFLVAIKHVDCIRVRSRATVTAVRTDHAGDVLWHHSGGLADTIAALLALPDQFVIYRPYPD